MLCLDYFNIINELVMKLPKIKVFKMGITEGDGNRILLATVIVYMKLTNHNSNLLPYLAMSVLLVVVIFQLIGVHRNRHKN